MFEPLQKHFLIDIQEKLYEKETEEGNLAVYQTSPFGMVLTLNHQIILSENDGFFFHEMMAHPACFTFSQPQKAAIVGYCFGILQEVMKHPSITHLSCILPHSYLMPVIEQYFPDLYPTKEDKRIEWHTGLECKNLSKNHKKPFDIIIAAEHSDNLLQAHYKHYFEVLSPEGILVEPRQSSLMQFKTLKPILQNIYLAGFNDCQTLHFPQPSFPSGFRIITMATKHSTFKRLSEKAIFNKPFPTRYYNFDTHKAALALPEFMRAE